MRIMLQNIRQIFIINASLHIHMYVNTYIYIYIYIFTYINIYVYICIYIHIYNYIFIFIYKIIYLYIFLYIIYIYTYIYVYIQEASLSTCVRVVLFYVFELYLFCTETSLQLEEISRDVFELKKSLISPLQLVETSPFTMPTL